MNDLMKAVKWAKKKGLRFGMEDGSWYVRGFLDKDVDFWIDFKGETLKGFEKVQGLVEMLKKKI